MIERSYDGEVLRKASEPYPEILKPTFNFNAWASNKYNILLKEGEDVGAFTYEYPGMYNAHYFLTSRGKTARDLVLRTFKYVFETYDVKILRGLTKADLKAARWMARQFGFKSYGIVEYPNGPHELFIMTKDEFYDFLKEKGKI